MLHELKIYTMYFNDILKNNKNFEVRKDDKKKIYKAAYEQRGTEE